MVINATMLLADHDGHMGWGWDGGWWIMMLGMVLFWGAIIFLVVWAVRGSPGWGRGEGHARRETPEEILDRRFAEGDLSAEEYRERREVITSGSGGNRGRGR